MRRLNPKFRGLMEKGSNPSSEKRLEPAKNGEET
jgi:hypothetical protein